MKATFIFRALSIPALLIFIFACITEISNAQSCDSLTYTCNGTFSSKGFYFDLVAGANDAFIESISTMSQGAGSRDVEMYYRQGTTLGNESDATGWNLIGSTANFSPLTGLSCPIPTTQIPIALNVCIPAGQRYGFYLIMTSGTGSFEADDVLLEGDTAISDGILTLYTGKGTFSTSAFNSFLYNDKTFQGTIQYSCACATGIASINESGNMQIFPVPALNQLNIKMNFTPDENSTVYIYNIYGELVKQENVVLKTGSNYLQMDISDLPQGVFFVSISDSRFKARRTFIKL